MKPLQVKPSDEPLTKPRAPVFGIAPESPRARPFTPRKSDKELTRPASYEYGSRVEKPRSLVVKPLQIKPSDEPLTKPVAFPFEYAYGPGPEAPRPSLVFAEAPLPGTVRSIEAIRADIAYIENDIAERDVERMGRKRGYSKQDPYRLYHKELLDRKWDRDSLHHDLPALREELDLAIQLAHQTTINQRYNAAQSMIEAAAQERAQNERYFRSYMDYDYAYAVEERARRDAASRASLAH